MPSIKKDDNKKKTSNKQKKPEDKTKCKQVPDDFIRIDGILPIILCPFPKNE